MSRSRTRDRKAPQTADVYSEDEGLARLYFGEGEGEKRGGIKTAQLCKQVERAASVALAVECDSPVLVGAWVAAVEPAPDASRLRITVILAPERGTDDLAEAWAALSRATPAFRAEVARSISRKRVPELAWGVHLAEGMRHE